MSKPTNLDDALSLIDRLMAAGEKLYAAVGELDPCERPLENDGILAAGKAWCDATRNLSE